eukprot:9876174-Ditylum_brightwellii.AAC.1
MKDGKLKLYWKTIKKVKLSIRSEHWKYEKCSDVFTLKEQYVGMSEVRDKKMYFVVSDWFLDDENNKLSFSKEFINYLVHNTPTPIEDIMQNNFAQVIKNVQNNYVKTIIPTMVDTVLQFQVTLGNDAQEM